jgi:hypothetical protein
VLSSYLNYKEFNHLWSGLDNPKLNTPNPGWTEIERKVQFNRYVCGVKHVCPDPCLSEVDVVVYFASD